VKVNDTFGRAIAHQEVQKSEGVKEIFYTPSSAKPVTVEVNFGGVAVPNSPYRVYVNAPLDPTKVQVFGPWVDNPDVKPHATTHFIVDAR
jgi:filamin